MIDVRLFRHLWSFLAVAEERHFGRAAERLGISQPPLTQQIQTLERSLGMRLFERSRHGATLTHEGQAILPAVRRFVDQLGHLETLVRAAKQGHTQFVTIGAITSAFYNVLPGLLQAARAELPDITASFVEIHTADAIAMLQSGTVDIAFSRLIRAVGSLQTAVLATEHLIIALPPQHRLAGSSPVRFQELANEAFIQVRRQLSPVSFDLIVGACMNAGFSPHIAHEVGSEASQIAFVSCGLGIAILPGNLLRFVVPKVVFRPLLPTIAVVTLSVAWDDGRFAPGARAVVELALRQEAAEP